MSDSDLRGLRKLRDAAGKRFAASVVHYDGSATLRFESDLFAVPVRQLWGAARTRRVTSTPRPACRVPAQFAPGITARWTRHCAHRASSAPRP